MFILWFCGIQIVYGVKVFNYWCKVRVKSHLLQLVASLEKKCMYTYVTYIYTYIFIYIYPLLYAREKYKLFPALKTIKFIWSKQ